jgi:hypothetical protein
VPFYNPSARANQKTQPVLLRKRVYCTLPNNGRPIVACLRFAGMYFQSRWLAMVYTSQYLFQITSFINNSAALQTF